ncbi:hypothetical protein J1614_003273 [Plenodomus biglobosus]|nr:hypothetical protein J1614_003273 [Plenodomus biglobosus]
MIVESPKWIPARLHVVTGSPLLLMVMIIAPQSLLKTPRADIVRDMANQVNRRLCGYDLANPDIPHLFKDLSTILLAINNKPIAFVKSNKRLGVGPGEMLWRNEIP